MNNYLDLVGVRLVKEATIISKHNITSPLNAVNILANELKWLDREMMLVLNLNIKHEIINAHIVSIGSTNASLVDIKSIFKSSLLSNATSLMLIHNHPSGHCEPSKQDLLVTDKIKSACDIMDIEFLDHIVIGKNEYYSFQENKVNTYENNDLILNEDEYEEVNEGLCF